MINVIPRDFIGETTLFGGINILCSLPPIW